MFACKPQKSPATTGRLAIEPQDRNQIVRFGTYSVNSVVCVSDASRGELAVQARRKLPFLHNVWLQSQM